MGENNLQDSGAAPRSGEAWVDLSRDDVRQLLLSLVGYIYGDEPERNLQTIRAGRMAYARKFIRLARVKQRDKVLDLGSGCGFGTRAMAQCARWVWACDISPAYLNFARAECAGMNNIEFVPIASRDLSAIPDAAVDVVISMSVFVHLNLYDMYWYFNEFRRVVRPGGRVCIDFANMHGLFLPPWRRRLRQWLQRLRYAVVARAAGSGETVGAAAAGVKKMGGENPSDNGLGNTEFFVDHARQYRRDPHQLFGLMQWNSAHGIRRVAAHHGFRLRRRRGDRLLFVRVS